MTHPLYQNAKFAPYEFQEYPKMVYLTEADYPAKGKVVSNPEEELEYLGFLMKDKYPKAENQGVANQLTIRDGAERQFLVGVLKDMGSTYDENASIEDLRAQMRGFIPQPSAPAALPAPTVVGAASGESFADGFNIIQPVAPVAPVPGFASQADAVQGEGEQIA